MSRFDWRELHYAASFRLSSPAWRIAGPPQGWAVDPQLLLPAGAGLVVEQVRLCDEIVRVTVRCAAAGANCLGCGSWSEAFHSGYKRNLGDLPIAGRQAVVDLWVRRFRCYRPECPRKIFVEQAPVLAERYAHRTLRLRSMLESIGFSLGGRLAAAPATIGSGR